MSINHLILKNFEWSTNQIRSNPDFFKDLSSIQQPHYLWIGCSDARVPANTIVGLKPGEVFVHRNIANLVVHSDLNCLSVIQYAVEYLQVKEIIICGHYGCGGIQGALGNQRMGLIDNWLRHVKDIYQQHRIELNEIKDPVLQRDRLCELNVKQQVMNLCSTNFVQEAWENGKELSIHGLVYDIRDGLLRKIEGPLSQKEDFIQMRK